MFSGSCCYSSRTGRTTCSSELLLFKSKMTASRVFLASFLLTIALGSHAREVDQYLAWGVDLADSGPTIDVYMREKMREAIELEKVSEREMPPPGEAETTEDVVEWYLSCYGTAESLLKVLSADAGKLCLQCHSFSGPNFSDFLIDASQVPNVTSINR